MQPNNHMFKMDQSISSKAFVRAIGDEIYLKIPLQRHCRTFSKRLSQDLRIDSRDGCGQATRRVMGLSFKGPYERSSSYAQERELTI